MAIVWPWPGDVDTYVKFGRAIEPPRPPCPDCGMVTDRWSWYRRHLRDEVDRLIWVARVRCAPCKTTHALLPWFVLPRRWDTVDMVGRAIEMAATGQGYRAVAAALHRPATTVRDWLRRSTGGAEDLAAGLLGVAAAWGWSDWALPAAGLSRLAAAVQGVAQPWRRRRGDAGAWRVANHVTGGRLLAATHPRALAAATASAWMAAQAVEEVGDDP